MTINQGDIYWVQLEDPGSTESAIPHPYVVIQDNALNHSQSPTVVACALTSNIKRVNLPGNVLLEAGEANGAPAIVRRLNGRVDLIVTLAPGADGRIAWLYIMRNPDKLPA